MGELYFSPSSASYLVCDLQGVTCNNAAFAVYRNSAHPYSYWHGEVQSMDEVDQ